jgi:two-component system, NtrC family, sensor kinase
VVRLASRGTAGLAWAPMPVTNSLRRELLLSLFILFGGALALAITALYLAFPYIEGPGMAIFFAGCLITADLAILFLFARAMLQRRLLAPLESMAEDAQRIAEEEYDRRMERGGSEEMDTLAESLNAMADRLIANQDALARNIESLDLTNRELVTARDEVVRAARLASVGTLAAGLAHEVGNPLGAVLGYLDLARRRDGVPAEQVELLDAASQEARRIDRIIRSLLDYARPRPEVHGAVDSVGVIDRVRRLLDAQGRFEGIECTWELPEDLPEVHVDPNHLEQVLVNLLLNAADAMEASPVRRIRVAARTEAWRPPMIPFRREGDPPGTNYAHRRRLAMASEGTRTRLLDAQKVVVLIVEDSGPGIPPEAAARVFDPFFTTKEPGKGTGLGLAICARLVEEMGGKIELEKASGGGARFRVILPTGPTVDQPRDSGVAGGGPSTGEANPVADTPSMKPRTEGMQT